MTQYPTPPNDWLYRNEQDGSVTFTDYVIRNEETPAWLECTDSWRKQTEPFNDVADLDFTQSIDLSGWNPTDKGTAFLENFLHHIAERLAVGPTTNRLTLTLSANVYSACGFGATIDDPTDIRYLIKKAIQDRNWKVTDGTNNFNQ